jgi:D-psicose/D-tagatose/L-ribulose 3-epimerase
MAISIGVNAWVWQAPFTNNDFGLIDKAVDMGFDTFEIGLEDQSLIDPKKLAAKLKQTPVKLIICGAFGPSRDLTSEDPKYRKESLDYMAKGFKFCEAIGTTIWGGPSYSSVGKRRQISPEQKKKEWDLAVKGLTKAAKMAADHGVKIALEPINRFETDLINTSEQVMRMINDIGEKNVGAHLDTFHMNIEELDSGGAIRHAGSKLFHLHACGNDRGAPGAGSNMDWKSISAALKDIKYNGAAVIESFTPACSIAGAAAIWRPLAKTQDALASDGYKYLKKLLA